MVGVDPIRTAMPHGAGQRSGPRDRQGRPRPERGPVNPRRHHVRSLAVIGTGRGWPQLCRHGSKLSRRRDGCAARSVNGLSEAGFQPPARTARRNRNRTRTLSVQDAWATRDRPDPSDAHAVRGTAGSADRGSQPPSAYITAPTCHGTNSLSPRPSASDFVSWPEAVALIIARISCPLSARLTPRVTMSPVVMSMSSGICA